MVAILNTNIRIELLNLMKIEKHNVDTVGFEPRSTTDSQFQKETVPVNGDTAPKHPQSWSIVWTSDLTAIMSFCLYLHKWRFLPTKGSGETLAGPQTINSQRLAPLCHAIDTLI